MKRKLLIIDTETGGLDANVNALISIAALVYHEGGIEDRLYEVVLDPAGTLDPGALKVNGFTAERIAEEGKSAIQVVNQIEAMLMKNEMRGRVTVCAHNAPFDMMYLKRLWSLAGKDWAKRFSYRALCTQTGALLLEQAGRLNLPAGSASLDNLTKLWGISLDRGDGTHNALADAEACAAVLKKELELISASVR